MRQELNQIEEIEKYLAGKFNSSEHADFEAKMLTNELLNEQVIAQKLVQQAAVRKAIRADVLKYSVGATGTSGWTSIKWFSVLGGGLALIAILLGSYFWINQNFAPKTATYKDQNTTLFENKTAQEKGKAKQNNFDNLKNKTSENNEVAGDEDLPSNTTHQGNTLGITNNKQFNNKANPHENKTYASSRSSIGELKSWATPEIQYFEVLPNNGATIECKGGTLIVVPKNAFIDDSGNIVTTNVTVEVVEALTVAEMVGYNLVTVADGKPLASGGMIYVQPKTNGKKVSINPKQPLYIEIPTENYNPKMMAWESEIDEEGNINWKNPKPLEKFLTKIDFANLDFLPKGFAQAVAAGMPYKHYAEATDELVDSLYYNFGVIPLDADTSYVTEVSYAQRPPLRMKQKKYFGINSFHGKVVDPQGKPINNVSIDVVRMGKNVKKTKLTNRKGKFKFRMVEQGTGMVIADKKNSNGKSTNEFVAVSIPIPTYYRIGFHQQELMVLKPIKESKVDSPINPKLIYNTAYILEKGEDRCYINPQSIRTIRSNEFSNTYLATKEFEQRIQALHLMPNANSLFELYVNNLSNDLWEVDQQVADRLSGADKKTFEAFASQKLTNVKNDGIYQQQLSEYYNREKEKYIQEVKSRQEKYVLKSTEQLVVEQMKLQEIITKYNRLTSRDPQGSSGLISQNYPPNAVSGYQSISKVSKIPKLPRPVTTNNVVTSSNTYSTTWFKSGWMNIDSYLHALGKNPKEVTIDCSSSKNGGSKTKIYQCLNSLKAVIPLVILNQIAKAPFPNRLSKEGRMMRSTYCVGLRENHGKTEIAYQKYDPYQTDHISLAWEKVDPKELIKKLRLLPGFNNNIIKDIKAEKKAIQAQIKQIEISKEIKKKQKELTKKMEAQQKIVAQIEKEIQLENVFMNTLKNVVDKCNDYQGNTVISPLMEYPTSNNNYSDVFSINEVEVQPHYKDCKNLNNQEEQSYCTQNKLRSYIEKEITIPESTKMAQISGKVLVTFVVDDKGNITGASLLKGLQTAIDEEVLRAITTLPKMVPAVQNNKNVSVRYQIPVTINFQ